MSIKIQRTLRGLTAVFCFLLIAVALICATNTLDAHAATYDGSCGDNLTYVLDTTSGTLTISGNGAMTEYDSYSSVPWYSKRSAITSVVVRDGVTTIGKYAFYECSNLESVSLPDSITAIGVSAFNDCVSIKSVNIPEGVTSIGDFAFRSCVSLTSIVISDNVASIGEYAFYKCSGLTSVNIPESVLSIGAWAFYGCSKLTSADFEAVDGWWRTSSATATSGTSIPEASLSDAASAATCLRTTYYSYYLKRTVTHVHKYTAVVTEPTCTELGYTTHTCKCGEFYVNNYVDALGHVYDEDAVCSDCGDVISPLSGTCGDGLTWEFVGDGELVISGSGVMYDFESGATPWNAFISIVTYVTVEEGVTSIGANAFNNFRGITAFSLPETLISIGESAFAYTRGIRTITLPEALISIRRFAFHSSGVKSVIFGATDGWSIGATDVSNDIAEKSVAATYLTTTYSTMGWVREVAEAGTPLDGGNFNWVISSTGILTITGKGTMPNYNYNDAPWEAYKSFIVRVDIGEGITSVGRCAFFGCTALKTVNLPETLGKIEEYAFYGCSTLAKLTLPENVSYIGSFAFRRAVLTEVTFDAPHGWSAGEVQFTATEIAKLGADYLTLGYYKNVWVRNVDAEEEVIDENFVIGGMCNTRVKWSLSYVDDTKTKMKLTITGRGGAMPEYGTGAAPWYGYLNDIVEIEVGEGVTTIGRCAFYGLKFVNKVTLAEGIASIGDYAFASCSSLKSIDIPESVTSIASTAFNKTGLSVIPTV